DPDPDLIGALGRAAQILEMAVMKGLKPAVDHASLGFHQHVSPVLANLKMRSIFGLRNQDSGALLDSTDPTQEQLLRLELRLEGRALVGRQRDQQATGGLRVEAERDDRLRGAVEDDVGGGEVAVARVAARA